MCIANMTFDMNTAAWPCQSAHSNGKQRYERCRQTEQLA